MKLSFSTLGCPDWTLEQLARNGASYGFNGVELRISGNRHVDPAFDAAKRKAVRALFADHGLAIACLSGYTQFCGDDAAVLKENGAALLRNAGLAADLGAAYVRSFLGDGGDFTGRGAEVLRWACDKARERGVTVLLEIHDALKTGAQAAQMLAAVNSAGLAVLWDIHHSLTGGESPEETWHQLGRNIRHVHMKDADAANHPCLMGCGVLPCAQIARLLEQNGFDGYVSFEWEKMWLPELDGPEIALPHYIEFMRKALVSPSGD